MEVAARAPRPRYNYPAPQRTVDTERKAVIDEVDPALLARLASEVPPQPQEDMYLPASGPAMASPSNLSPIYANARQDLGPGSLEANVLAGANSYQPVRYTCPFLAWNFFNFDLDVYFRMAYTRMKSAYHSKFMAKMDPIPTAMDTIPATGK